MKQIRNDVECYCGRTKTGTEAFYNINQYSDLIGLMETGFNVTITNLNDR